MRIFEACATWALVTMTPSVDQITPEPLPRSPGSTSTVERRSFSAISPKSRMAILFASARAFADDDVDFLRCAAADEFECERLADGFAMELRVDILKARDGMAGESDENVADNDASFIRRALRLDFKNDGRGFFGVPERLAESIRQTNRLQAHAEIPLRDVALFQQGVDDAVDRTGGNGDGTEASETRRGDADRAALGVDYRAADGSGLQADVEADVRCEGGAGPRAALCGDQAYYSKRRDGTAGAGSSDDQRDAARL